MPPFRARKWGAHIYSSPLNELTQLQASYTKRACLSSTYDGTGGDLYLAWLYSISYPQVTSCICHRSVTILRNMENTQGFQQHLTQAGLSAEQARLYESLVKNGPSLASDASRRASVSRTLGYKVLGELIGFGLVDKKEDAGKVAIFTAAHPLKLKELIEKREQQAKDALTALEGVLGQMTSEYNIAGGRPGVQFYEGIKGIREVAWDTLTAKEELRMFADVEAIRKYIPELNAEYVAERKKRGIKKKTIVLDTAGYRESLKGGPPDLTDTRLIKTDQPPFRSDMHIYDGKVSYITFSDTRLIGIIISDPQIYATHKYLFDFVWEKAEVLQAAIASPADANRSNAA